MQEEQRKEVINALVKYVIRVTNPSEVKSPEEMNALPAIVGILFSERV